MNGYILTYRSLMSHWIWKDDKQLKRWIYLLFMAAFQDTEVEFGDKKLKLKEGQYVTTLRTLAYEWRTNESTVLRFLRKLKQNGMISYTTTRNYTLITITNYVLAQNDPLAMSKRGQTKGENADVNVQHLVDETLQNIAQFSAQAQHGWQQNEINNKENNKISFHREREEKFFDELKKAEITIEGLAMQNSLSKSEIVALIDEFLVELSIIDKGHKDFDDARRHFYYWLKNRLQKQQNGTRQKQSNGGTAQDRHSARRGTDVGDKTAKDYSDTF